VNDIFGFFIQPAAGGAWVNVAMLPGSSTPVSIRTINTLNNTAYYVDNR
jgi:hypothetical protein